MIFFCSVYTPPCSFPGRQRGREVMKISIGSYHRNFAPVYHHARAGLRLARNFHHVPVLNKRSQFQIDRFGILFLEMIVKRFFSLSPIPCHSRLPTAPPSSTPLPEIRDGHGDGNKLFMNQCRGKIRIAGDTEAVTNCIRHRRPGELLAKWCVEGTMPHLRLQSQLDPEVSPSHAEPR